MSPYITPAFALFFGIGSLITPALGFPLRYRWWIPATLILLAAVALMRIVVEPSPDTALRVLSAGASVVTAVIAGIHLERVRVASHVSGPGAAANP